MQCSTIFVNMVQKVILRTDGTRCTQLLLNESGQHMKSSAALLRRLTAATVLASLALTGCERDQLRGRDAGSVRFSDTQNIQLHADGHPVAIITADGQLLIGGKPVALSSLQQSYVLTYRSRLKDVAKQGIETGKQGVKLGASAVSEVLSGVFSGQPERINDNIHAQSERVQQAASEICDLVATLRIAQDELASHVPEFAPYVDINERVIADCRA